MFSYFEKGIIDLAEHNPVLNLLVDL